MKLKLSYFSIALMTLFLAFTSCKNDNVTRTGKPLNDAKSTKVLPGSPIYENMQGVWIARGNPSRKLDLRGGKFKMYDNDKLVVDGEFVFYKDCPPGCFPPDLSGTTPCFTVRTSNDLRCYSLRELTPDVAFGFLELSSDDNEKIQSFDRQK
jgi:hypothetical protein